MANKLSAFALVALTGIISAAPALAQNSVSKLTPNTPPRASISLDKKSERQPQRGCRPYFWRGQAELRQFRGSQL